MKKQIIRFQSAAKGIYLIKWAPQANILRFQGATNEFYIENEPPEASQFLLGRKMFYPDLRRWVQFLPASLREGTKLYPRDP